MSQLTVSDSPVRRVAAVMAIPGWQFALAAVLALLSGCATVSPGGRAQLAAPGFVASAYSEINMNLELATASGIEAACSPLQCLANQGLDRQVARLGFRLTQSAFALDPSLRQRIPHFGFSVAEKESMGTASNAAGEIVVFRGVRKPAFDEKVLGFLLAREMGRVIAHHHEEQSGAWLLSSILTQAVLPIANLAGGTSFLAGSIFSTWGSQLFSESSAGLQAEADQIALGLLQHQGWTAAEIAESLYAYETNLGMDNWSRLLQASTQGMRDRHTLDIVRAETGSADRT